LTKEIPTTWNKPVAFSTNRDVRINVKEYFDFSPTKTMEKGLINANYFKSLREKQQSVEKNTESAYFKLYNHALNKNEKEDSFEIFMKDFKDVKNKVHK
jgi:hypothetical protein